MNPVCAKHLTFRLIAILLAAFATLAAQSRTPDPNFSDFPFDQWAAGPEHATIKWTVRLPPAELSPHQRLLQRIEVLVPGHELEKRRGRGELVVLARFEDSDGRQWHIGNRLNLVNVQPGVKSQELTFTLAAFVKPGDYKVQTALYDSQTMEHSFTHRALHVAPLKADPLPQAWLSLPPVEVLPVVDGPDTWFLPDVKGLLHLPVETKQPLHIDFLINSTPSERAMGLTGSLRRNMASVLPALKVLSAINAKSQPATASVIDLTRHKITFEASNAAALDWRQLSKALTDANPGIIDVGSLAGQRSMREFFAGEVARRAGASGPPRWLIVMSGALFFSRQEDSLLPELPPDPNRHIVYLRFSSFFGAAGVLPGSSVRIGSPERIHGPVPGRGPVPAQGGRGGDMGFPIGGGRGFGPPGTLQDDLERVLKPMGAREITITTPEQFRKVVANLIEEMSVN
jgi:hypothetical protein